MTYKRLWVDMSRTQPRPYRRQNVLTAKTDGWLYRVLYVATKKKEATRAQMLLTRQRASLRSEDLCEKGEQQVA